MSSLAGGLQRMVLRVCTWADPQSGDSSERRCKKTTAYMSSVVLNPVLTLYHVSKTLERVVKAVYHMSVAFFASLLALGSCCYFTELNNLAQRSWKFAGGNLHAGVVSASCTLRSVGCFFQGFFSIKVATEVQYELMKDQRVLDVRLDDLSKITLLREP